MERCVSILLALGSLGSIASASAFPLYEAEPPAPRRMLFGVLIAAAFVLPVALLLRRRRPPGSS